jgi:hypothetical protein
MQSSVACARQARITLIDLGERVSFMEVGVVIIARKPTGSLIGDLVGLGREGLVLDETAKWFGVSEMTLEPGRWPDPGAQLLFVITAGEVIDLARTLVVDFLAQ